MPTSLEISRSELIREGKAYLYGLPKPAVFVRFVFPTSSLLEWYHQLEPTSLWEKQPLEELTGLWLFSSMRYGDPSALWIRVMPRKNGKISSEQTAEMLKLVELGNDKLTVPTAKEWGGFLTKIHQRRPSGCDLDAFTRFLKEASRVSL